MKIECNPCGHIFDAYDYRVKYVNPFVETDGFYCPFCKEQLESPKFMGKEYFYYSLLKTTFKPSAKMSCAILFGIFVALYISLYLFLFVLIASLIYLIVMATNKVHSPAILCKKAGL